MLCCGVVVDLLTRLLVCQERCLGQQTPWFKPCPHPRTYALNALKVHKHLALFLYFSTSLLFVY